MAVAVSNSVLVRSSWSHRENVPAKGVLCGRLGGSAFHELHGRGDNS